MAEKPDAETSEPGRGLLGFLARIENRSVRRALSFLIVFFVSLGIGHVCERLFDGKAVQRVFAGQSEWLQKLQAMAPLALVKGYAEDFGPASAGRWVYQPPPPPPPPLTPQQQAAISRAAATQAGCALARARPQGAHCPPPPGLSASECLVNPDLAGCRAFNACRAQTPLQLPHVAPECAHTAPSLSQPALGDLLQRPPEPLPLEKPKPQVHALLLPFAALVRTLTRLFAGGAWGFALASVQLAMGLLGLLVIGRQLKFSGEDLHPAVTLLVVVPIGSVVVGSVLALGLQWLMLGVGYLFHWVTGLAAAAAGAGGTTGFCWLCLKKLTEQRAEALIAGK